MGELREYKCRVLKGSVGNTEYWTDDDWVRHRKYVEELKESDEYLKPEDVTLTLEYNELFDEPNLCKCSTSYRFDEIDLSKKQ